MKKVLFFFSVNPRSLLIKYQLNKTNCDVRTSCPSLFQLACSDKERSPKPTSSSHPPPQAAKSQSSIIIGARSAHQHHNHQINILLKTELVVYTP